MESIRLEFACTYKERQEAQSLQLRKQLGGGSKWRTWLMLGLVLACLLLIGYAEFFRNPSDKFFVYVFPGAFVFSFVYVHWKKRKASKIEPKVNIVEISRSGVTMMADDFKSFHPWSAYSACLESPNLFVLVDKTKWILYILPKRAFPDENSQNWFRTLANEKPSAAEPSPVNEPTLQPLTGESVSVEFQLRLSDYFDRTLASWQTWGLVIGILCLMGGSTIYAFLTGPPNPVVPPVKVFFMAVLPMMLLMVGMVIWVSTLKGWRAHKKFLLPQKLMLLESGMQELNANGFVNVPWNTYVCYKETRRSIILWRGRYWHLIPKRAFKSRLDEQSCLSLLRRNLRQSRWFFG